MSCGCSLQGTVITKPVRVDNDGNNVNITTAYGISLFAGAPAVLVKVKINLYAALMRCNSVRKVIKYVSRRVKSLKADPRDGLVGSALV